MNMADVASLSVPKVTREAVLRAVRSGIAPLSADAPQSLSQWASSHFVLSAESSHTQGRWRPYPFQIGWMDAFSNDDIEEVDVKKSKRVGYTKTLVAFIAYNAAKRRRKQAIWQPTDDDRDSFVKTELEPMLRDVKAMRTVARTGPGAEDTIKLKTFLASVLHMLGGKAARAFRRITVGVSMLDELDAFDLQVEGSADPVTLAYGRLEGAPFPKLVCGSTPRIRDVSHVEHRESLADAVMRYEVSCAHCGKSHPLEWTAGKHAHGLKWSDTNTGSVWHVCPHCGGCMHQHEYLKLYEFGFWRDIQGRFTYGQDCTWRDASGNPCRAPRHVAFRIWAAYSEQRLWADIVREYLAAEQKRRVGDNAPMQGFVNETLGETYLDDGDTADEHALRRRAEAYPLRTVPHGALVVTAGVDTQGDRLEAYAWAWGRGEESWLVDHQVFYGDPSLPETEPGSPWAALTDWRRLAMQHASGAAITITATAVDSGGHHTDMVYRYARRHAGEHVLAVKGSSMPGRAIIAKPTAIEFNHHGKRIKNGGQLWLVGTDTAKGLLYGRMQVQDAGPGYVHTSAALPSYVWEQLTAERVVTRYIKGHARRDWVKPAGRRNEALDCAVYAMAAAWHIGVPRHTDAHWQRYENRLRQADLLGLTLDTQAATMDAVAQSEAADADAEQSADAPATARQQQGNPPPPAATQAQADPATHKATPATPPPDSRAQPRPPMRRPKRAGWVTKW